MSNSNIKSKSLFLDYVQASADDKSRISKLIELKDKPWKPMCINDIKKLHLDTSIFNIGNDIFAGDCWQIYITKKNKDIIIFHNSLDFDFRDYGKDHPVVLAHDNNRDILIENPSICLNMLDENDTLTVVMFGGQWRILFKNKSGKIMHYFETVDDLNFD